MECEPKLHGIDQVQVGAVLMVLTMHNYGQYWGHCTWTMYYYGQYWGHCTWTRYNLPHSVQYELQVRIIITCLEVDHLSNNWSKLDLL